jgi:hypothetical protein
LTTAAPTPMHVELNACGSTRIERFLLSTPRSLKILDRDGVTLGGGLSYDCTPYLTCAVVEPRRLLASSLLKRQGPCLGEYTPSASTTVLTQLNLSVTMRRGTLPNLSKSSMSYGERRNLMESPESPTGTYEETATTECK